MFTCFDVANFFIYLANETGSFISKFLNEVAEAYFSSDAYELERMTHVESPWLQARGCLSMDAACNTTISQESMKEYYRSRVQE